MFFGLIIFGLLFSFLGANFLTGGIGAEWIQPFLPAISLPVGVSLIVLGVASLVGAVIRSRHTVRQRHLGKLDV